MMGFRLRQLAFCASLLPAILMAPDLVLAANPYADPAQPALPPSTFQWDPSRTALVVIDPQIDFMSPEGAGWPIFGQSVQEQNLVPNLHRLMTAFKESGTVVSISPHYYYPHDHKWKYEAPAETVQHKLGLFDRKGALTLDGFRDSGADWVPELKPLIEDGQTIVASPHKLYGPQSNDLMLQLGKQRINKIVDRGHGFQPVCRISHARAP